MAKTTKEVRPRWNRIDFFRQRGPDFFEAASRCIEGALGEGPGRIKRWAALNPHQQGLHAWWGFLGDVLNGGLVQYFYNHTDAQVPALSTLLEDAGCGSMGELFGRATAVYREHREEFAVDNPFGTDGLFARMKDLAKLDRPVERQLGRTGKLLEKWVRDHIALFAVGDDGRAIDPAFSGSIETHRPDGRLFEQAVVRLGKLSGPYRRFSEGGTLEHSCYYKAGEISADYWPDGQVRHKTMRRGKLTLDEWYFPSGRLQKRFVSDKTGFAVEPIRLWHEDGQLAEEIHLKEGDKVGPWLKFFDDGAPRLEAEYREGETLVIHNAWDDQRRQVVKAGRGAHFDDGRSIEGRYWVIFEHNWTHSRELRGGIPHGLETTWNDGVLFSTQEFKKGERHGAYTLFYENGRVRKRSKYRDGEEVETESFPKFDDPRPAVLLEVEANAKLYAAWRHPPLDTYPTPLNADDVQGRFEVPEFLQGVFERNLAGELDDEYEDINTFDDTIAYMVMVDEAGDVDQVACSGASPYSGGAIDRYPPFIHQLKFEPGQIQGRAVRCRVLVWIHHTFIEANSHLR